MGCYLAAKNKGMVLCAFTSLYIGKHEAFAPAESFDYGSSCKSDFKRMRDIPISYCILLLK